MTDNTNSSAAPAIEQEFDRSIETRPDSPGFDGVIQKGLVDIAAEYSGRARQYYAMAKEYAEFSSQSSAEILVVEDNESNGRLVATILEKEGLGSIIVGNGDAALAYCRDKIPLAILMDIDLPDGCGLEFTKTLRGMSTLKFVPIIAVTAHVNSDTMRKAMEVGCDNFIGKPFTKDYFVRIIQQQLESVVTRGGK